MKIAFSSSGPSLDSLIDPRFGRCAYLLVLNEKGNIEKSFDQPGEKALRGAGISTAQVLVDSGAEGLVTGNIGPNAFNVLTNAGIKIYVGAFDLTIKEALEQYKNGKLPEGDMQRSMGQGMGDHKGPGMGGGGPGMGRGQGGPGMGRGRNRQN